MNFASIEKIADAVLYEGYILYPYRPSAIKNQQRWNFGTLFPRVWAEAQKPHESFAFHTEVLVEGDETVRLEAHVRFLQIVPAANQDEHSWDEGFARSKTLESFTLQELMQGVNCHLDLAKPSGEETNRVPLEFRGTPLNGRLSLRAAKLREGLYRIGATFANETHLPNPAAMTRREAQGSAFTSAHLLLHVGAGAFVSLLEPAAGLESDVAACSQSGVFPVLAGEQDERSNMLCAPIILYDYPQIAPESAGDFFDGTEMDEMLALRVMTLTDEEKSEMRRSDPHARAILDRTETLPKEQLLKVHGAVRGMRVIEDEHQGAEIDGGIEPWNPFADPFEDRPPVEMVRVFGVEVRKGDRVRLWPQKRADIMDMALHGKVAIVEAIEQDLENNLQFAVVLEDDPGRDMGMLRQAGHRFFYSPDEVEPLALDDVGTEAP